METTYVTLNAHEILVRGSGVAQASGGEGRRLALRRITPPIPRRENNVISFQDYCTRQTGQRQPPARTPAPSAPDQGPADSRSARRGVYLELVTSAALIGVAVSACVAFLI